MSLDNLSKPDIYFDELNLKKVDDKLQFTVCGFIKNAQQLLNRKSFNIIPKNIILIILAFYAVISDKFDPNLCGEGIQIFNNITLSKIVCFDVWDWLLAFDELYRYTIRITYICIHNYTRSTLYNYIQYTYVCNLYSISI